MKQLFKQLTFTFARTKPGAWMIWIILRYFPFLIPFKKLYQDPFIIAIPHPIPSYTTHLLILPRIYLPDFLALDIQSEAGINYVHSMQKALNVLLADMEQTNMQLVINGGDYQDVKLLHIHLIEYYFNITQSQSLQAENSASGLSELLIQAKHRIQNTKYSAYRLLFSYKENQIQLQLQMKM